MSLLLVPAVAWPEWIDFRFEWLTAAAAGQPPAAPPTPHPSPVTAVGP